RSHPLERADLRLRARRTGHGVARSPRPQRRDGTCTLSDRTSGSIRSGEAQCRARWRPWAASTEQVYGAPTPGGWMTQPSTDTDSQRRRRLWREPSGQRRLWGGSGATSADEADRALPAAARFSAETVRLLPILVPVLVAGAAAVIAAVWTFVASHPSGATLAGPARLPPPPTARHAAPRATHA